MSVTVYIPREATALSLGAQAVARALSDEAARRKQSVQIVRPGSRALFWLEPLVEVQAAEGRIAYGPVKAADIPSLFAADFLNGGKHPLNLGPVEAIPYLKNQERPTSSRLGVIDPVNLDDYRAHGGYEGLKNALPMEPAAIVKAVTAPGLRGRGGGAFPPA